MNITTKPEAFISHDDNMTGLLIDLAVANPLGVQYLASSARESDHALHTEKKYTEQTYRGSLDPATYSLGMPAFSTAATNFALMIGTLAVLEPSRVAHGRKTHGIWKQLPLLTSPPLHMLPMILARRIPPAVGHAILEIEYTYSNNIPPNSRRQLNHSWAID